MKADEFAATSPFPLDKFQLQALEAIDAGRSVLVAAPTGAGKTVVAEYAVAKALAEGGKAFYTTPLKALSNQKYGDFSRRHGPGRVGLLTGDNAIAGDAPVVVMTTEVLRNMIYSGAPALDDLRYVVLDEVHYLQDAYRGPVWEEVIIHSPPEIDLVCLSATVSNAEEFADWIQTVRGATTVIIEEHRPVELRHLYMVGDRDSDALHLLPTFVDGQPNPEAARLDSRAAHESAWRGRGAPRTRHSRLHTPRRAEVVERLGEEGMLPAIYFIFSRMACDDAVRQCLDAGLRLTSPAERVAIRAMAEAKTDILSDADLDALGYGRWLAGLEGGFAAHHAGMVPLFKEAVEACFSAGLVKVVFATETLALGINMPARTVVIEKLSKFTGERHEFLTPGEYTQLTGRAGRRGIDELGNAVVLWSPFVPFDQVAGLASTRTYALSSSFHPTYNMAANLVRRYAPDAAHHLLNLSFAQYRADRDVVRLEAQLDKLERTLEVARQEAVCDLGDVEEYRQFLSESGPTGQAASVARARVEAAVGRLRPGDVLLLEGGKSAGRVVVISTSHRRGGDVRLGVLTPDRRYLTLSARDFANPPGAIAHLEMPSPYAPRNPTFQRTVVRDLARMRNGAAKRSRSRQKGQTSRHEATDVHPVAGCPDVRRHLRASERAERIQKDIRRLERRIQGRSESLARQFDRVLRVLDGWGYVDKWSLTPNGEQLVRIYHECDLVVAEALRLGLFDELDAPSVAALASAFTYEARGPARRANEAGEQAAPWFPSPRVKRSWHDIERIVAELNRAEAEAGLPMTRGPDPGFFAAAYGWAAGEELADVIAEEEFSGGDFVRNIKQLIDLVRQIAEVSTDQVTAKVAQDAAERLFRGVVVASSVVGT
ncbi:MAG TPA: DEAD/DEAH box helicase [Acidimicrobiales bacterium]|nr:DEAD/DEAH box helicase [Acidimicrobiales bacterium]